MEMTTIGLDLAKRAFQAHGGDKAALRRKLQRAEVLAFFEKLPPCLVGIEACGTAHCWAREIRAPARQALGGLVADLEALGSRAKEVEAAILAWHKDNEASRRLATIPGVGPITA